MKRQELSCSAIPLEEVEQNEISKSLEIHPERRPRTNSSSTNPIFKANVGQWLVKKPNVRATENRRSIEMACQFAAFHNSSTTMEKIAGASRKWSKFVEEILKVDRQKEMTSLFSTFNANTEKRKRLKWYFHNLRRLGNWRNRLVCKRVIVNRLTQQKKQLESGKSSYRYMEALYPISTNVVFPEFEGTY